MFIIRGLLESSVVSPKDVPGVCKGCHHFFHSTRVILLTEQIISDKRVLVLPIYPLGVSPIRLERGGSLLFRVGDLPNHKSISFQSCK